MRAGQLNRWIEIQKRGEGTDPFGQPIDAWIPVGGMWAGVAGETGLGAIRGAGADNVPASIARYSLLVRFAEAQAYGIKADMRAVHDGEIFDIKGLTRDFKDRDKAFIVCEQGGNNG